MSGCVCAEGRGCCLKGVLVCVQRKLCCHGVGEEGEGITSGYGCKESPEGEGIASGCGFKESLYVLGGNKGLKAEE